MFWNKKLSVIGFASIAFVFCNATVIHGAERPEITIPRTDTPPLVDGDLSDPCWEKAALFDEFYIFRGGGEKTDAVSVRTAFDDEWLYFAFEVKHPDTTSIHSEPMAPDSPLAGYDSVEVFVEPGTGGETYLHYMLGANNARSERRCTERGASKETMWKVPWRSATKITETGWQAEMAVPLAIAAEYGNLKDLTMLIGANRIVPTRDRVGALVDIRRETFSFIPAPRGFHHPAVFARVRGLENVKPKTPLLVAAGSIQTSSYQVADDGSFFYQVSGLVMGYTGREGDVRVDVLDKPTEGDGEQVWQQITVAEGGDNPFSINVPVKILSDRTAELMLVDPDTDEILLLVPLRDMAGLSLMNSYIRYSYYTTEKIAQVVCELGLPEQELAKMSIGVKDADGKDLAVHEGPGRKNFVHVPLADVTEGQHQWTVDLRRSDGEAAVVQTVAMIKRAPRPGAEWKIDHGKRRILNNGEPFFPFGIMAMIPSDNDVAMDMMSRDVADAGFNTVVRWGRRNPVEKIEKLLDMGEKHGFYVIDYPTHWSYEPPEEGGPPEPEPGMQWPETANFQMDWTLENVILPGVEKLMHHPRLMAWYLWDEPQRCLVRAAAIEKQNNGIYSVDGYHPTQVLYSPPVPDGDVYSRNCDVLGIDPYWVPGAGAGQLGNPNRVGWHTWLARQRADKENKLVWVTPVASRWSASRIRLLNENEQRVQTYLTLIHGAQGLLYFVYPFRSQVTFNAFQRLGREMRTLGPACVAGEVLQEARYTPTPLDPFNNIFPDVQTSLKRNPDGGYILLAANWRAYPVEASITVSLLGGSGKVSHLFDDKPALEVVDSTFTDTFEPMSTRAYVIPGLAELTEPVEIGVDLKPIPEQTDTFYTRVALSASGVPGRKNLLRNSSFEEESIPGIADYYFDLRTGNMQGRGWRVGDRRGDSGAGICTEHAYHGEKSVRLQGQGGNAFMLFWIHPEVSEPTPYVFSAWVKGAPDSRISFYGPVTEDRVHTLTGEWQRIVGRGVTHPQPLSQNQSLFGFTYGAKAGMTNTVWIDAIQFELGTELTDYEP